jgi:hypothetical protein
MTLLSQPVGSHRPKMRKQCRVALCEAPHLGFKNPFADPRRDIVALIRRVRISHRRSIPTHGLRQEERGSQPKTRLRSARTSLQTMNVR